MLGPKKVSITQLLKAHRKTNFANERKEVHSSH